MVKIILRYSIDSHSCSIETATGCRRANGEHVMAIDSKSLEFAGIEDGVGVAVVVTVILKVEEALEVLC